MPDQAFDRVRHGFIWGVATTCAVLLATCLGIGDGNRLAHPAPPAPELKIVRAGEVELHYVEQGSGTPIVFVHGSVDDYRAFEPQLEPLSRTTPANGKRSPHRPMRSRWWTERPSERSRCRSC